MSAKKINHLSDNFWTARLDLVRQTMTREQFRETLLATGGDVIVRGRLYDVQGKHMGAGLYQVTLHERRFKLEGE